MKQKFGMETGKLVAPSLASFITFFLVGMWHGMDGSYIPFSLYNALLVAQATLLENFYAKCRTRFKVREEAMSWRIFQNVRTFFLVTVGGYLVMTKTPDMIGLIKATFRRWNPWIFFDGSLYTLGLDAANFWLLLISIIVLMIVDVLQERGVKIRETIARQNIVLRWCIYYAAIFALLIFGMYGPGYDAASFIY